MCAADKLNQRRHHHHILCLFSSFLLFIFLCYYTNKSSCIEGLSSFHFLLFRHPSLVFVSHVTVSVLTPLIHVSFHHLRNKIHETGKQRENHNNNNIPMWEKHWVLTLFCRWKDTTVSVYSVHLSWEQGISEARKWNEKPKGKRDEKGGEGGKKLSNFIVWSMFSSHLSFVMFAIPY